MDLVDLNGMWTQRLDYLIEGNEAHRLLQAKFMSEISGGQVEYRITSSIASNPSGTGRADIVYFNTVIIPSVEYPDKEIVYHVYENGLINYYYRKKKTQEKPATSSEKVKEQEKDYSGLERIGIFAFGSALFLGAAVLFV